MDRLGAVDDLGQACLGTGKRPSVRRRRIGSGVVTGHAYTNQYDYSDYTDSSKRAFKRRSTRLVSAF